MNKFEDSPARLRAILLGYFKESNKDTKATIEQNHDTVQQIFLDDCATQGAEADFIRGVLRLFPDLANSRTGAVQGFNYALHLAAISGNLAIATALILSPLINVNQQNMRRQTALHLAAKHKHSLIMLQLVQHAACDVNIIDIDNKSATRIVCENIDYPTTVVMNTVVHFVTEGDVAKAKEMHLAVQRAAFDPRFKEKKEFFIKKISEAESVVERLAAFVRDSTTEISLCRDILSKSSTERLRHVIASIMRFPVGYSPAEIKEGLKIQDDLLFDWFTQMCPRWAKLESLEGLDDVNAFYPGNLVRMMCATGMHRCLDFLLSNSLVDSGFNGDANHHQQSPLFIATLYARPLVASSLLVYYKSQVNKMLWAARKNPSTKIEECLKILKYYKYSVLKITCQMIDKGRATLVPISDLLNKTHVIKMQVTDEVSWVENEIGQLAIEQSKNTPRNAPSTSASPHSATSRMSLEDLVTYYQHSTIGSTRASKKK